MEMIKDWERISEAFAEFAKVMAEKMEQIREVFEALEDPINIYLEWKNQREHVRDSWIVPADTRMKSQVMINKPRNLIRKVIK